MKKATLYDYVRMCESNKFNCEQCLLPQFKNDKKVGCWSFVKTHTDKANEIILNWCKEHPVETRQDRFLKMFPNARKYDERFLTICPNNIDDNIKCNDLGDNCDECRKKYWLAEVEDESISSL